jgi:hypothetical protein
MGHRGIASGSGWAGPRRPAATSAKMFSASCSDSSSVIDSSVSTPLCQNTTCGSVHWRLRRRLTSLLGMTHCRERSGKAPRASWRLTSPRSPQGVRKRSANGRQLPPQASTAEARLNRLHALAATDQEAAHRDPLGRGGLRPPRPSGVLVEPGGYPCKIARRLVRGPLHPQGWPDPTWRCPPAFRGADGHLPLTLWKGKREALPRLCRLTRHERRAGGTTYSGVPTERHHRRRLRR